MSFPKMGKVFHPPVPAKSSRRARGQYAVVVAGALRDEVGETHNAIKTIVKWTGASERTVKNWLAGTSGPSGEHLISLARHSDEIFATLLLLAGREPRDHLPANALGNVREHLQQALALVQVMTPSQELICKQE